MTAAGIRIWKSVRSPQTPLCRSQNVIGRYFSKIPTYFFDFVADLGLRRGVCFCRHRRLSSCGRRLASALGRGLALTLTLDRTRLVVGGIANVEDVAVGVVRLNLADSNSESYGP